MKSGIALKTLVIVLAIAASVLPVDLIRRLITKKVLRNKKKKL